jgi:hypothetical protein
VRAVILIPYRDGGDDRRAQLWDWTQFFLAQIGWPIVMGDGAGEFSRSAAVNDAARRAGEWDVALIGDADTVQQPDAAWRGARAALQHGACVPWTHRIKLSEQGTDQLVRRGPSAVTWEQRDPRDPTRPWGGGGTICVARSAWDVVGGFDQRYSGYGNEDLAFLAAVETLCIGNGAPREHGLLWHLWHRPHKAVGTRLAATPANQALWQRYREARWRPEAMRALIREAR